MEDLSEDTVDMSKLLYHLLIQICPSKKSTRIFRRCERHNGLSFWRALANEHAPKLGTRLSAMLAAFMDPSWKDSMTVPEFKEVLFRLASGYRLV